MRVCRKYLLLALLAFHCLLGVGLVRAVEDELTQINVNE